MSDVLEAVASARTAASADHGTSVEPTRMDLAKQAPDAYRHLVQLEGIVAQHVERNLLHLVKLRGSQINGCAFCIAMHTEEALRDGEAPVRLTLLDAWREATLYTPRERAALNWVEEISLIASRGASATSYERIQAVFDQDEIAWLTLAGTLINAWNRIAIASRAHYPAASKRSG